jgi:hypothetical protein
MRGSVAHEDEPSLAARVILLCFEHQGQTVNMHCYAKRSITRCISNAYSSTSPARHQRLYSTPPKQGPLIGIRILDLTRVLAVRLLLYSSYYSINNRLGTILHTDPGRLWRRGDQSGTSQGRSMSCIQSSKIHAKSFRTTPDSGASQEKTSCGSPMSQTHPCTSTPSTATKSQ